MSECVLGNRAFLSDMGMNMVYYHVSLQPMGMVEMQFSLYINEDVTLHREFMSYGNKDLLSHYQSAWLKLERLKEFLVNTLDALDHKKEANILVPIGDFLDCKGNYVGESSTALLQLYEDSAIVSISSCNKKIRTTIGREDTRRLFATVLTHLEQHMSDVEELILPIVNKG